jgi:predicted DCC family thiol-disulfide oxidoreductase YuxK
LTSTNIMREPRAGWVLYDGACGFCSWWVPFWGTTLRRAGFEIAPLQSSWLSDVVHLDSSPLSWDLTLLLPNRELVAGANVYRYVMRRVWWTYPLYLISIAPGFSRIFDWSYTTFAKNRYCVSRTCGLDR